MTKHEFIEEMVEKAAIDVYGSVDAMPSHNKQTLRDMLSKEYDFWQRNEMVEDQGFKWREPREY